MGQIGRLAIISGAGGGAGGSSTANPSLSADYEAADIAARDAGLVDNAGDPASLNAGDLVFVADASADTTVDAGWAIYRWNGTAFDKVQEQEGLDLTITHALDSQLFSGVAPIDVDFLLADLSNGQAFHFQTLTEVTLSSANDMSDSINGLASFGGTTRIVPAGVQGYLARNGGTVSVNYTTATEQLSAGVLEQSEPPEVVTNAATTNTPFTPAADGVYSIRYFGDVAVGNGGIVLFLDGVAVPNLEGLDFSNEPNGRIDAANNDKTVTFELQGGAEYEVRRFAGGGSTINDFELEISYVFPEQGEFIENLDHDTRYRIFAEIENVSVQGGGDSAFIIDTPSVDTGNRFVTDNGDGTYTVTTEDFPLQITASFNTLGTGNTTRVFYIHDSSQPNGTRVAGAIDGVFGQGAAETPARATIPANTTITIGVRSVSSAQNQRLQPGSFLDFTQLITDTTIIANAASTFRISRHEGIVNINGTIETGHDLTQAPNMFLKIFVRDQATDRGWQIIEVDVDNILETEANSNNDGFGLVFDNDFITFDIVDAATGEITFNENGRNVEYVWSELWITAPTNAGVEEIQNVVSLTTTGTFQNLGDPSVLFTGADGDRVNIEYGDGNRDTLVFLDGIAREERQGFSVDDLEIQVIVGGQIQIRDTNSSSTISRAWYEFKDGVVRTTKSIISTDCTVDIVDTGPNQDVSVNPIGINEYINNIEPYHIVLSHEGAGGNNKTVNVNGVGATFDNLQNATDNGSGAIQFSGGVNGNFNRRGSTIETITRVGEFFEVITGATGQFDTQFVNISTDPTVQAESATTGNIRIRFAAAGVTVFDESDVQVFTDVTENGTYRIKRTYFGFLIQRNGVDIYESPEVINDFSASTANPVDATQTPLHYAVYGDGPAQGGVDILATVVGTGYRVFDIDDTDFAGASFDPDGLLNVATNSFDVQQDGLYELEVIAAAATGAELGIFVDGVEVARNTATASALNQLLAAKRLISLIAGQRVEFGFVSGGVTEGFLSSVSVKQLPTTESVLASNVVVEPIADAVFSNGTPVEDFPNNTAIAIGSSTVINQGVSIDEVAKSFTLSQSDTPYHCEAYINFDIDTAANADALRFRWQSFAADGTASTNVGSHNISAVISDGVAGTTDGAADVIGTRAYALVDASAGDVVIQVRSVEAGTDLDFLDMSGRIHQSPRSSVVSGNEDAIPDFDNSLKTDFILLNARPYTVITDAAGTVANVARAVNTSTTPFVEIEVLRDNAAAHGLVMRANSTGGRQSQVRFDLGTGATLAANSGANTSLPIVHRTVVGEDTIKWLVEFTDPAAHTEIELSPAGANADLTVTGATPPLNGSVGVFGVDLYEASPVVVSSNPTGIAGADIVSNIVSLTQAEFDAIATPDPSTLYIITDA